jgi:hypothetical protein
MKGTCVNLFTFSYEDLPELISLRHKWDGIIMNMKFEQ